MKKISDFDLFKNELNGFNMLLIGLMFENPMKLALKHCVSIKMLTNYFSFHVENLR